MEHAPDCQNRRDAPTDWHAHCRRRPGSCFPTPPSSRDSEQDLPLPPELSRGTTSRRIRYRMFSQPEDFGPIIPFTSQKGVRSVTSMEQHPGDTSTKDDGQEGDGIYVGDQESSQEQDSPAETEKLPMSGVRVIDVGTFLAGPYAAPILGEFGAEILKVEHPIAGDPMRR